MSQMKLSFSRGTGVALVTTESSHLSHQMIGASSMLKSMAHQTWEQDLLLLLHVLLTGGAASPPCWDWYYWSFSWLQCFVVGKTSREPSSFEGPCSKVWHFRLCLQGYPSLSVPLTPSGVELGVVSSLKPAAIRTDP